MNKYKKALNRLKNITKVPSMFINEIVKELVNTFQELVDSQEKIETIIKEYEIKLGNLKEYTQGHSLLNGLICDLKKLVKGNENE